MWNGFIATFDQSMPIMRVVGGPKHVARWKMYVQNKHSIEVVGTGEEVGHCVSHAQCLQKRATTALSIKQMNNALLLTWREAWKKR